MKKLLVVLLLIAFGLNAISFAQTDKEEIRRLVFEAPTFEAIEKSEGEELLVICYWISLLAAYGEIEQAIKVAEQINSVDSQNGSKPSYEGYLFVARGMACNNHLTEAIQLLRKLLNDKSELQASLVFLLSEFSDADAVMREVAQIPQAEDRDEVIDLAIQIFLHRRQKDQAKKLVSLISSPMAQENAAKEITDQKDDEKWGLNLRAEEADVNPLSTDELRKLPIEKLTVGGLLALERHEEAINKAIENRDDEKLNLIAEHLIEHRFLHQARLVANLCSNPLLKLDAYIDILEAHLFAENPDLKIQLRQNH